MTSSTVRGSDRGRPQCPQEGHDVTAIESTEIDPRDPLVAFELGHEGEGRIPSTELAGPERDEEQDRGVAQVA